MPQRDDVAVPRDHARGPFDVTTKPSTLRRRSEIISHGDSFDGRQRRFSPVRPAPRRYSLCHQLRGKPVDADLNINGHDHRLSFDVRTSLLDVLREHLGLTGTKKAATTASAAPARCWSTAGACCPA